MGRKKGASYRPNYSLQSNQSPSELQPRSTRAFNEDSNDIEEHHNKQQTEQKQGSHVDHNYSKHSDDYIPLDSQRSCEDDSLFRRDTNPSTINFSSLNLTTSVPPFHPSTYHRTSTSIQFKPNHISESQQSISLPKLDRSQQTPGSTDQYYGGQAQQKKQASDKSDDTRSQQSYSSYSRYCSRGRYNDSWRSSAPSQRGSFHGSTTTRTHYVDSVSEPWHSLRSTVQYQSTNFGSLASPHGRPVFRTNDQAHNRSSWRRENASNHQSHPTRDWSAPPLPIPKPSQKYLANASQPPARRSNPQKLLVILDLNGTLLVRPNRKQPTKFTPRPGINLLLDYLFSNHIVMIYSSTRPNNVQAMLQNLLHPNQSNMLAAVWARDKLGLTQAQYNAKVQVYKRLEPVWADASIQATAAGGAGGRRRKWDHTNTVLVDDNIAKGAAQPHNLIQIPEFTIPPSNLVGEARKKWHTEEQEILESLQKKLEELKWQVDVTRLIREWHAGVESAPGVVDESLHVEDEIAV